MKKNNLDEMQDRKLLKLEEYGFWIMFWASTDLLKTGWKPITQRQRIR